MLSSCSILPGPVPPSHRYFQQKIWFPLFYHLSSNIISLNVCLFLKTRELTLLNLLVSSPSTVSGTKCLRICEIQLICWLLAYLLDWYSGKLAAWWVDWLID